MIYTSGKMAKGLQQFFPKTAQNLTGLTRASALALSFLCAGCASVVSRDAPTVAHIHIGHAITGWVQAPGKQGLLVVAETTSVRAAANSDLLLASARNGNLERSKKYLNQIALAVDPEFYDEQRKDEYGLRRAAAEAITHLKLASEVPDASSNVLRTVTRTLVKAEEIINRADELIAFLDAGMESEDVAELEIIAEEIALNVNAIAGGPETQDVYGLYEFRQDIENMVAREKPPYKTVDSWYLFNLVKLPDGKWGFSSRSSRGAAGAGY